VWSCSPQAIIQLIDERRSERIIYKSAISQTVREHQLTDSSRIEDYLLVSLALRRYTYFCCGPTLYLLKHLGCRLHLSCHLVRSANMGGSEWCKVYERRERRRWTCKVEVNQSIDFLYHTSFITTNKMQALEYDDGPLVWVCPLYTHTPTHCPRKKLECRRVDLTSRSTVK
jgi:hypothetical protein